MVRPSQIARPTRGRDGLVCEDPLARLAALFAEHGKRLERLAAPLLRGSGAAPEDVVGDVVLRYAERLADDAPVPDDELAYLAQMVRNRSLDIRRSASRCEPAADVAERPGASTSSAEDVALGRERLAAFFEDVSLLPERQRRAVLDVSVGGLSHRDSAQREDVTPQTSKSLLARAVRNLRAFEAARQAPCDGIRTQLEVARHRGRRPAEEVRRHLRVCAPCRLADARVRGGAGRARLGALLGGWGHSLAELLHGPVAVPLSKSLAAAAVVVATVPLSAPPGPEPAARRPALAPPAIAERRPVTTPTTAPRREAVTPAPRRKPVSAAPVRAIAPPEPEPDRVGAWRGLMAELDEGGELSARSGAAVRRWCVAAGEKGLMGTKALSARCPARLLDTPVRRAKVARVQERRRKDADRARREPAAAADDHASSRQQAPAAAPVVAAAPAPAPEPPPPAPAEQPTGDPSAAPPPPDVPPGGAIAEQPADAIGAG